MELEEGVRYPVLRLPNKLLFFCFLRYGFLCSLGCSEINFVNYAGLELRSSCLYLTSPGVEGVCLYHAPRQVALNCWAICPAPVLKLFEMCFDCSSGPRPRV